MGKLSEIAAIKSGHKHTIAFVAWCAAVMLGGCNTSVPSQSTKTICPPNLSPLESALFFIRNSQDYFHSSFIVYDDRDSGGLHFFPSGWMGDIALPEEKSWTKSVIQDAHSENPGSGLTCIKVTYPSGQVRGFRNSNLGGVYFQYPDKNWGKDKGHDLTPYTFSDEHVKLVFAARGERGREKVLFKAGGINRPPYFNNSFRYQDSFGPLLPEQSRRDGMIPLTTEWREYEIDLPPTHLSNVIGGFCWIATDDFNPKGATFYLDDIRIMFGKRGTAQRLTEPRFLRSYTPLVVGEPDIHFRNASYVYDQALTLLAFLAMGGEDNLSRAKLLADAFLVAQNNDRLYSDGRLRNGYSCGDLLDASTGKARLPGWWNESEQKWSEDEYSAGSDCGNMAWAIIALLSYWEKQDPQPNSKYLQAAERMAEWIHKNNFSQTQSGPGGYTGGFEVLHSTGKIKKSSWKSTEHNIDLYVAFARLARATGRQEWTGRAEHAKTFVRNMWEPKEGHYWTGTKPDSQEINKEVVPLDVHTWAVLAFDKEAGETGQKIVDWAAKNCFTSANPEHPNVSGFDFKCIPLGKDVNRGIWWEGDAQMQLAMKLIGRNQEAVLGLENIKRNAFSPEGGIFATTSEELNTGFSKPDWGANKFWMYYRRPHLGATCWYIFAELGWNPYWSKPITQVSNVTVNR